MTKQAQDALRQLTILLSMVLLSIACIPIVLIFLFPPANFERHLWRICDGIAFCQLAYLWSYWAANRGIKRVFEEVVKRLRSEPVNLRFLGPSEALEHVVFVRRKTLEHLLNDSIQLDAERGYFQPWAEERAKYKAAVGWNK
jgi:hypothetical protein